MGLGSFLGIGNSSSSSKNTTYNTQANVTGGNDSINLSAGDGVSVNVLDGGAIGAAFEAIAANDAQAGVNFSKLLEASRDMFTRSTEAAQTAYKGATNATTDAYTRAAADLSGGFDQKTVVMLAGVAVLGLFFITRKS